MTPADEGAAAVALDNYRAAREAHEEPTGDERPLRPTPLVAKSTIRWNGFVIADRPEGGVQVTREGQPLINPMPGAAWLLAVAGLRDYRHTGRFLYRRTSRTACAAYLERGRAGGCHEAPVGAL